MRTAPTVVALLSFATVTLPSAGAIAAPAPAAACSEATTGLSKALELAGANRAAIERALERVPSEQAASMEWLVARMPAADLKTLDAEFLLAHVDGAYKAWKSAPWSAMVDEETFRDGILPYASISETRELWLPALRAKCLPMIGDAKAPSEAAVLLNQRVFPEFKVKYSTKRRRADQSPSESMESGLASCSGLSILLVDACRSVGVPARFVGVPMWTDGSGNHSWVEVWDGARWRFTGAAEPSGDRLDEGWFGGRAAGQNRAKPEHAIYAVTWRDTGVEFPMVFDPSRPRARAVDVTDRYTAVTRALPEGHAVLRVCVRDPRTGLRVAAEVEVRDARDASVAKGLTKDERFDLNDHLEVVLPADSWSSFLVNGTRAQEVAFVARDGRAVQAVVTMPVADAAGGGAQRSSPGAVRGADDGLLLDAGFMPPEVIAVRSGLAAGGGDDEDDIGGAPAGTDGAAKAGKPGAAAIRDMQRFLKDGAVADVAKQPFAAVPLTEEEAARALARLRKSFEDEVRRGAKAEFESKVLEADGAKMPFWYAVYGDKPKSGRSLFISMHGGGGAPKEVNDKQWDNQKRLYKPEEGVYVAPRAPTDTWNLWHQGHIDTLFRKLITDMVVFEGVNPDRVYIMGYSAGGDGVYQLAPRMADSFAAAAMMAGHPNETRPDGLRNIPFALFMGGKDAAFSRNDIARQWKTTLAGLAEKDPGGYTHEVTIHEENGHWMDRKDAVGVPWMAKFTRNLHPTKVVWLQDDVTSPRFYWLANAQPKGGQRVVAVRDRQTITIEEATGVEELTILLDDDMVDLDAPVKVVVDGATAFEGVVPRTLGTAARTLAERGDPQGIFLAEVRVKIPAKSAN